MLFCVYNRPEELALVKYLLLCTQHFPIVIVFDAQNKCDMLSRFHR